VIIYHIIELLNLSELDRIYPEILELCLDAVHSKRELQKCVLNTKTNMQATNTAGMSKVYHGARVRVTVWGKERERERKRDDCIKTDMLTWNWQKTARQMERMRFSLSKNKKMTVQKLRRKRLSNRIAAYVTIGNCNYVSLTWRHKSKLFLGRSMNRS